MLLRTVISQACSRCKLPGAQLCKVRKFLDAQQVQSADGVALRMCRALLIQGRWGFGCGCTVVMSENMRA